MKRSTSGERPDHLGSDVMSPSVPSCTRHCDPHHIILAPSRKRSEMDSRPTKI